MSRSLPWYFSYEGEICRVAETASGALISEVWSDTSWIRGGNVAELTFKGVPISAEEAARRTSSPVGELASAGEASAAAHGHDDAGASRRQNR